MMDASEAVAALQVNSFFPYSGMPTYRSIDTAAIKRNFRKRQNASNHYLSGGSHQFNGLCEAEFPRAQLTLTCGGLPLKSKVDIRGGANLTIASQWTDKMDM
uniref:Uncharacterized protein n=1 Tax=Ditylenchus dipsaci TaxID=166011 RepID=A0A915E341_9BILA